MAKGYWIALYKKIESKENLGNYASKATTTQSHVWLDLYARKDR